MPRKGLKFYNIVAVAQNRKDSHKLSIYSNINGESNVETIIKENQY